MLLSGFTTKSFSISGFYLCCALQRFSISGFIPVLCESRKLLYKWFLPVLCVTKILYKRRFTCAMRIDNVIQLNPIRCERYAHDFYLDPSLTAMRFGTNVLILYCLCWIIESLNYSIEMNWLRNLNDLYNVNFPFTLSPQKKKTSDALLNL